jgi:transposase
MSSVIYVGMDVHQDSFSLCALDSTNHEIIRETKCSAEIKNIVKFVNHLPEIENSRLTLGYEAGIWGYSLYNQLMGLGYNCVILAPSTMYSNVKHQMVKNDHQDAQMIAHNLAAGTYKAVYVPDQEDDEVKEFIRLIKALKVELKKTKQRIRAFVLRNGFRFERTPWTGIYLEWLSKLQLPQLKRVVLNEYLIHYHELTDKIDRLNIQLEDISHQERYHEPIAKLRCFKGIDTTTAMTIHVETSDFSRFPNAKAYAAYLGLTPSENSSGHKVSLGRITKQGNITIRTTLVESAQSLVRGDPNRKSKKLKARQTGQSGKVINYADQAVIRLHKRYERMLHAGKPRNVAIIAVARELACFIWGMENNKIS